MYGSKKVLCQKKIGVEKVLVQQKNFGFNKKIFKQHFLLSKFFRKNLVSEIILGPKEFRAEEILSPKNFMSKQISGSKNYWIKKYSG